MRDQYAGDVSDLIKFALLRDLAGDDSRLGVAWYYVPGHDGREDGRHLEWRDELAWEQLDSELHAGLSLLPERTIDALERAPIWPRDTLFFRERMPTKSLRDEWRQNMVEAMDGADIVFLDPDNGLGKTGSQSMWRSLRFVSSGDRQGGRHHLFSGRSRSHNDQVRVLHHRLRNEAGAAGLLTLRTNVSVPRNPGSSSYVQRQRWFTLIDPSPELMRRTRLFCSALATIPRVRTRLEEATPV